MERKSIASLVVFIDPETGEFKAEIPAANGSRRKIEIRESELPINIVDELVALNVWLRDQDDRAQTLKSEKKDREKLAEAKFAHARHQKIWDVSAGRAKLQGKEFANKVIGQRNKVQNVMDLL